MKLLKRIYYTPYYLAWIIIAICELKNMAKNKEWADMVYSKYIDRMDYIKEHITIMFWLIVLFKILNII